MSRLYKFIDKAVLMAVANLYLKHNKIILSGSKINGTPVSHHVFNAIYARIKYNANLQNKKSGQSRIILNVAGKLKVFKVNLTGNGVLKLITG
ncbi:MAG: hypothetical protein HZA49_00660 [Planctomycetes bacterium]|nr:hypothetical protein [Planctomycetota bacterium]